MRSRILLLVCAVIAIAACSTANQVEVVKQTSVQKDSTASSRIDSLMRLVFQKDTTYVHDSVFVCKSQDTIYIYKEHQEITYKSLLDRESHLTHDTILVKSERVDSIPYPVVITKYKEKKYVPWYTKGLAFIGGLTLLVLIGIAVKKSRGL